MVFSVLYIVIYKVIEVVMVSVFWLFLFVDEEIKVEC